MPTHVDRFASAAEEFCAWCELEGKEEVAGARTALRYLTQLYSMALDLRMPPDANFDLDGEGSDDKTWKSVFNRSATLPFGYYSEVFNPLEVPSEAPVVGDLGDDLADIHRDLTSGLSLYRDGHVQEAEWEWRFHFQAHWGRHAASAIRALHCWFADQGVW